MEKKVILVDCFNTIIMRKISPTEVMYRWAENVGKIYQIEPSIIYNGFVKIRTRLALNHKFYHGELEYRFEEVLNILGEKLASKINLDVAEFVKTAMEVYITTEQEFQYLNAETIATLREYQQAGKPIYIVSDFNCGKEVLSRWLEALGVRDLFTDIFVSCDYMKSKLTGRMYTHLKETLGIKGRSVLLIGDNGYGDIFKARLKGFSTKKVHTKYEKSDKNLKKYIKKGRNCLEYEKIFQEFGKEYNYSNCAFPLYVFTKRLYERLVATGKTDVFFLSREGWFLKKLFDKYCENVKKVYGGCFLAINSHYLYASRNSMQAATLKSLEEEDFERIFSNTLIFRLTVRNFLISIGFTAEDIECVRKNFDFDIDKKVNRFKNSKVFAELKANPTFKMLYDRHRNTQHAALKSYLDSFGVDFAKQGLVLVDIGFNGTMQDFFHQFLGPKVAITGYYLGAFKAGSEGNYKYGLLTDKNNKHQVGNSINSHNIRYYEQICRADHGRTDGYEVVNSVAKPVLDTIQQDAVVHEKYIKPLQDQILVKFDEIMALDYQSLSYIEVDAAKMYYRLVRKRSKFDTTWLLNSQDNYFDNFAVVGNSMRGFKRSLRRFAFKCWDLIFLIKYMFSQALLKFKL